MKSTIWEKISLKKLVTFSIPTVIMMIFTSAYTMVDGIFVSNYVNTDALSAINICMAIIGMVIGIGCMMSAGGCAVAAKLLGENKGEKACQIFTMLAIVTVIISVTLSIIIAVFLEPILRVLGATDRLMPYCKAYMTPFLFGNFALMLQIYFQNFYVATGHPKLGMCITIIAGFVNIVLDYVFIVLFKMGIWGSSVATVLGYFTSLIFALFFFRKKNLMIRFTSPRITPKYILKVFSNGSSEMVTNFATSIIAWISNVMMIRLLGEDGVAGLTIVLYGQFLCAAFFMGFSISASPLFSYNMGAKRYNEIKKLFKYCFTIVAVASIVITAISYITAPMMIKIFARDNQVVYDIAHHGIMLFSISYLFLGINVFSSAFFTAFHNGKVSAFIAFMHTFFLIGLCLLILPSVIGVNGIWLSVPIAEAVCFIISILFLVRYRHKYGYSKTATVSETVLKKTYYGN